MFDLECMRFYFGAQQHAYLCAGGFLAIEIRNRDLDAHIAPDVLNSTGDLAARMFSTKAAKQCERSGFSHCRVTRTPKHNAQKPCYGASCSFNNPPF